MSGQALRPNPGRANWFRTALVVSAALIMFFGAFWFAMRALSIPEGAPVVLAPPAVASPEALEESRAYLTTRLEQERAYSDRLLQLVLFTITTVLTIGSALFVFSWWSNSRLTDNDREHYRRTTDQVAALREQLDVLVVANIERAADLLLNDAERNLKDNDPSSALDDLIAYTERHDAGRLGPDYANRFGRFLIVTINRLTRLEIGISRERGEATIRCFDCLPEATKVGLTTEFRARLGESRGAFDDAVTRTELNEYIDLGGS